MTRSEFEHIAAQLRPQMLQVAQDFLGSPTDAEDVTQEAMLALCNYCERIDPGRNVEGLAMRVAKNCCVNWWRKEMRSPTPAPVSASSPSPHDLLEARDAQAKLVEVIARLKPRERELFELRQLEGLSTDEIAERTGIQKVSVKVMVCNARKKVFTELKKTLK